MRSKILRITLICIINCTFSYCLYDDEQELSPKLFQLDKELNLLNKLSAKISWDAAMGNDNVSEIGLALAMFKTEWTNKKCNSYLKTENNLEKRMMHLLCRGPKFTAEQARDVSILMEKISIAYANTEICIDNRSDSDKLCMKGEPDLEDMIKNTNLSQEKLLWIWKSWHDTVGPKIKSYFPDLVKIMNTGAIQNGYNDIGETWREELEINNLEQYSKFLYEQIRPLYVMLHGVVRYKLVEKYGSKLVNPKGKIPAHLLGNMWGQDWSSLIHLFFTKEEFNLNENLAKKSWSAKKMVEIAEDFYVSLGLPKMTDKFWQFSKIERTNSTICHGSAANMFTYDDYRIILCAELNMEDFYVIHHEMGHIEYYMAYTDQPTLFQDGANSAFQEAIGDSIMLGVYSPQHLYRLGLISDDQLFNKSSKFDEMLLLYEALTKIPQIPYGLMLDLYRWDIFKGKIMPHEYNKAFWTMNENIRGIQAPEFRSEQYFDAGAKFHVADNTPYIRYFLSSFIQADIFKTLCQLTVFGKLTKYQMPFPLHKCDIYGSRTAGAELRKFMSKGSTQHWSQSYKNLTGNGYIDYISLMEYFLPVYIWLNKFIDENNVPLDW